MSDFISCNLKDMTPEQVAKALITKNAAGEFGLRVVFIDADSSDAIDCNNASMTQDAAHNATIGLSASGKPALRLALPKGTFLNDVKTYADDAAAAAASPAIPVGGIYYKTGVGLHTRMS